MKDESNTCFLDSQTVLSTLHGDIRLPVYLPDATLGVVRAVDSEDLLRVGVPALVMNVYHLMQKPGSSTIAALGGLHRMSAWSRPILTDSGGFQAYSLVRQNPKWGRINEDGVRFKPEGADREFQLTPEKSIQLQMAYGADILVCLDDPTHVDDSAEAQEASVTRTLRWARRSREEFDRQLRSRKLAPDGPRPLLFGVVQGGGDIALRKRCAEALLEIGFDGYGYGGWPLDGKGNLLVEMLQATRELIPARFPMHALGVGHPESVWRCVQLGYQMADSALPTRDARSGRLYVWLRDPGTPDVFDARWLDTLYIDDDRHIKTDRPVSPYCDCPTCACYAIGYLRHLHKAGDTLFYRLATLHNLRFMTRLMERLQNESDSPPLPSEVRANQ